MTTDDQFEARVRRLLTVQADQLTLDGPVLTGPALRAQVEPAGRRAQRFVAPVLAAAAVLALFVLPLLVRDHDRPGQRVRPADPASSVVVPAPVHSPTVRRPATPAVPTPTTSPRMLYLPSMTPSVQTPTGGYPTSPTPFLSSLPAPTATSG